MSVQRIEHLANKYLTGAPGEYHLVKQKFKTGDIVELTVAAHEMNDKKSNAFANELSIKNKNDLYQVWKLVHDQIKYVADPIGFEVVKSPDWLWKNRHIGGDCKSFTNFIASILKNKVKGKTRFTGYAGHSTYKHVYPVIIWNGKEIPLDATIDHFGYEVPYVFKKDYDWQSHSITGIEGVPPSGFTFPQKALMFGGGFFLANKIYKNFFQ